MRTLVTFVLRLWVDPRADDLAWEGRVENVANGEQVHVCGLEELARFIHAQTSESRAEQPSSEQGRSVR